MLDFSETHEGSLLVIEVSESRLEASNAPELRELLVSRIKNGQSQIILDLKNVTFMDSSGLGALIEAIKKVGPLGTLALAGATGPVLQLLKLTRMDKVFMLFPSASAAVTKLQE